MKKIKNKKAFSYSARKVLNLYRENKTKNSSCPSYKAFQIPLRKKEQRFVLDEQKKEETNEVSSIETKICSTPVKEKIETPVSMPTTASVEEKTQEPSFVAPVSSTNASTEVKEEKSNISFVSINKVNNKVSDLDTRQRNVITNASHKNRPLRIFKDAIGIFFTWLSSGVTLLAIVAIFVFVFKEGWTSLNWQKFSGDYYAQTYSFKTAPDYQVPEGENFKYDTKANEFFSSRWGIAFREDVATNGDSEVVISYVDAQSPMENNLVDYSGANSVKVSIDWIVSDVSLKTDLEHNQRTVIGPKVAFDKNIYKNRADFYAKTFDANGVINRGSISTSGKGFRGSFLSSIYVVLLTLAFALPLGIGGAIYLSIYAKKGKLSNFISSTIDLLSGIPSIIFGLIGALVFIPIASGGGKTGNLLSGALTLAIMVLPLIVKNTQEAIKVIPKSLPQASLALGASQTQTVFKVILPNATSGILTGTILAIGRIIGESASLIFAIGTSIQDDITVLKPATTMAVHIWTVLQGETPDYGAACSIAIVILIMVLILNLILSIVSHYLNKFDANPSGTWFTQIIRKIQKSMKAKKEAKQNV